MKPLIPYFEVVQFEPIDGVQIQGFGVLLFTGIVTGVLAASRKSTRHGIEPDLIQSSVLWILMGIVLGGRLGHVLLYYPEQLSKGLDTLLQFRKGLSSFGGFVGVAVAMAIYTTVARRKRIKKIKQALEAGEKPPRRLNIWATLDYAHFAFPLAWFFGRMGCFSAHDHPGIQTEFWLGVLGTCPDQPLTVACHDLGLYEAIWSIGLFGIFLLLGRKARFSGFYMAVLYISYGVSRFFMDVLRHPDSDTRYAGFTPAQYLTGVLVIIGVAIWVKRKDTEPVPFVEAAGSS